jgi:SAM-dependent methyltransferase
VTISSSPQAELMADESMVRNLAAQIQAIWPQEEPIFRRHGLGDGARILDVGCGTGEVVPPLLELLPRASLVGVDLDEPHLERARQKCSRFGGRASFKRGDALELPFGDAQFDLVVSRHLIQALPDAGKAVREMVRVLKPGGRLHVLAEDYGMLWCHPTESDADNFWQVLPQRFAAAVGCDNHIGRKMFTVLTDLGLRDIAVDYMVVDTLRVARETFAAIWEAWRDGYTEALVAHSGASREAIERHWREMIACVRAPRGYALWQVPIWTARKP